MPPVGFEPTISAGERPQSYVLHRAATGTGKMQRYTVYLYLETALHVSGGTFTHHQDRIQMYLQLLVFVTPLLRSSAIVEHLELEQFQPFHDGWRYHPKHVEEFPNTNKLCNIAFCWMYIGIYLRCTDR